MGKHVKNNPYWFDNSLSTFTPMWEDTDLLPISEVDKLYGHFDAPAENDYYWGVDRAQELNNATYEPVSPYAYGYCYLTSEYVSYLPALAMLSNHYNYIDLNNACDLLVSRRNVTKGNAVFVPISVKFATDPATNREYYIELAIQAYDFVEYPSTGKQCSASIAFNIRIHDTEVGTDNLIRNVQAISSGNVLFETYYATWTLYPYFVWYYNDDSENPKMVYWLGYYKRYYNSGVDPYRVRIATGSTITNNGHTFTELWPRAGGAQSDGDSRWMLNWDSTAYEYFNPQNVVAYDAIEEDMGPYGPESDKEGYPETPTDGHGDDTSDSIDIPDDPLVGVTNVGFVNVYKTGSASLQNIGIELFPDLQYTNPTPISGSTDVVDSIQNGFNAIITALANIPSIVSQQVAATLINYIIDCHVIPVDPGSGITEAIKVGYKTLSASGERLLTDYVTFDCGSINIGEYYSSFADHAATSAKLFLPFVGFVPARTEWFYNDTLSVKYKFNIIDGSFVAYVSSTGKYTNNGNGSGTVVAQYSGNACVHLPITGVTYSSMVSGLVGSSAGAVAAAGSGNIAGVASSVDAAASVKGDIPQSNGYASSGAFLSVRRPYLMIERPVTNYSPTFRKERGLPSNISKKLSVMSGFTILQDIHLDGITATDAEKKELEGLLSKGVIF